MAYKAINLFNAYDLQPNPYTPAVIDIQAVVNYCEARFRAALQEMLNAPEEHQSWMLKTLFRELVSLFCFRFHQSHSSFCLQECCLSHIGVAATIGRSVNIPIIIRTLGHELYQSGYQPFSHFKLGTDFLTYLDGDLSGAGRSDPDMCVEDFYLPWWRGSAPPTKYTSYLSFLTIGPALQKHQEYIRAWPASADASKSTDFTPRLNKPSYTWHPEINNEVIPCTRCRLYRSVALGAHDRLRDIRNLVHACEIANQGERDIAGRRASGFNQLFEAALQKEMVPDAGAVAVPGMGAGAGVGSETERGDQNQEGPSNLGTRTGKRNKREKVTERVERDRERATQLWKIASSRPALKWTFGVDLTNEDLQDMVRGADRNYQLPHSGYDDDLNLGKLKGHSSPLPDLNEMQNPDDPDVIFDELSPDFPHVRELLPHEYPIAFVFPPLHHLGASEAGSAPAPDFARNFMSWKNKGKERMKEEVDRMESPSTDDSSPNSHSRPWFSLPPKDYVPPLTSLSLAARARKLMQTPAPPGGAPSTFTSFPPHLLPIQREDLSPGAGSLGPIYIPSDEDSPPHHDRMDTDDHEWGPEDKALLGMDFHSAPIIIPNSHSNMHADSCHPRLTLGFRGGIRIGSGLGIGIGHACSPSNDGHLF